jgi:hypothetical protein
MNKTLTALLLAACAFSTASHAQPVDPKLEWATRLVALQQGPELDALVEQIAASAARDLASNWEPRLETVPKAKQTKTADDVNAELSKFANDAAKVIGSKVTQANKEALVPAYMERFTLDELKQLTAFFESPAVKKYKAISPELVNVFVKKLVESSKPEIQARAKQFDEAAGKIIGPAPAAKPAKK